MNINALLFHPDQELMLIRRQKQILSELNRNSVCFFPFYPIYCALESGTFKNHTPEEIKKMIAGVLVEDCTIKDEKLIFPVRIQTDGGTVITEQITAGTKKEGADVEKTCFGREPFQLNCRIFKIARLEISGFTTEIWDDVWVKLRKPL